MNNINANGLTLIVMKPINKNHQELRKVSNRLKGNTSKGVDQKFTAEAYEESYSSRVRPGR